MQKIGDITNTADPQGEFTDGNVAQGVTPTILPAKWFNTIQRELCNAVKGAGIDPDPSDDSQLLAAINTILAKGIVESGYLIAKNNLSDLSDAATSRGHLGLGKLAIKDSLTAGDVNAYGKTESDNKYFSKSGGTVGTDGITSWGDITADGKNIFLKKGPGGGGYYIQNSSGKNLALISTTDTGDVTISSQIAGGSLRYNGAIFANNAHYNIDGNVNGSAWNGWLSDYLPANYVLSSTLKNTGGIGSLAFLANRSNTIINPSDSIAGSSLAFAGIGANWDGEGIANAGVAVIGIPDGTWKCLGYCRAKWDKGGFTSLFIRIA